MAKLEDARHIRAALQGLASGKLGLVARLREIAVDILRPVAGKVPRPMPDRIKTAYQANGIGLEWDLTTADAYEFAHTARNADLTPSQKSAAELLYFCTRALEENAVSESEQQAIVDAYAGLDLDATATGKKFTAGRKPNAGGKIRAAVRKLLTKKPAMKNAELWRAIAAKPPKGWEFFDNSYGIYADGPGGKSIGYARFQNVCAEERRTAKTTG